MLEAARPSDGAGVPVHVFGEVADALFGWVPDASRPSVGVASGAIVALVFGAFGVVLLAQVA